MSPLEVLIVEDDKDFADSVAEAPQPEIDLERLVWDPEYRDEVRRRLNRSA